MKKTIFLLLCLLATTLLQAQSKSIHLAAAGTLSTSLTATELSSITSLTVTGSIDARDFKTMRDNMPKLANIDLSGSAITEYAGLSGTDPSITSYASDAIPSFAFCIDITYIGKTALTRFIYPASVTSIGRQAFYGCSGLTGSLTIPATVTSIGVGAFSRCTRLTGPLTIPTSVTSIDKSAFALCSGFSGLTIPASVAFIGEAAFYGCSGLTGSLTIPSSVTSIGESAFYDCSKLTGLTIPASVLSISKCAFYNCIGLSGSLTIPASVTSIGEAAFYGCSKLTGLTIPASVTSIVKQSFYSCIGLTGSLIIPASVTSIGESAFYGCSKLTGLTIPASVTSIGKNAFYNCSGLTAIHTYNQRPINITYIDDVFYDVNKTTCTLYVPASSKVHYQDAYQWNEFRNIVEMAQFVVVAALPIQACSGSTVKLTATVDGVLNNNYSYTWSTGTATTPEITVNPTQTTTYYVTVADAKVGKQSSSVTVTVKDAPATPIVSDVSAIYNGSEQSVSAVTTAGNTVNIYDVALGGNLLVTGTTTATNTPAQINAGRYTYHAEARNTITGCMSPTRAAATITIIPKQLSVTASGIDKVYDGSATATVTLNSDAIAGDVVMLEYTDARFGDKMVGNGKAVSVSGISLSGTDAGNYTCNTTATATADITSKPLTVTASGNNKVYDGSVAATVTLSTDAIAGDVVMPAYTDARFGDKMVGNEKAVSVSGVSLSGTDAGNYTCNTTATATADITAKQLSITASGIDKVYDGLATATVTLNSDAIAGDEVTPVYTDASFSNKTVGNGKAVTVSGITLSGTDAGNYSCNSTAAATATITPKQLTVTATGIDKEYDGMSEAIVTLTSNAIAGDAVTPDYTLAFFRDETIGNDKIVDVLDIILLGVDAANYTYNDMATATANIIAPNGTSIFNEGGTTSINTVEVSPNPFSNDVTLMASGNLTGATYTINTQDGTVAASGSICNGTATANLSHLPVGIYIIRLHTATGTTSQMIVKQ